MDVYASDRDGNTPLSYAAHKGFDAIVKLLLQARSYTNHVNRKGRTPFELAVLAGHEKIVKHFLCAGAKLGDVIKKLESERGGWLCNMFYTLSAECMRAWLDKQARQYIL